MARALLEESLAIWRESGDRLGITQPLRDLGRVVCAQGDWAAARALFEAGLVLHRELGNKQGMAQSLEGLAGVAAGLGQAERAVRLAGAAQALRDAIGVPPAPAEHADLDRNMAPIRAGLDHGTFAVAWAEGWAMPPEQAISHALGAATLA